MKMKLKIIAVVAVLLTVLVSLKLGGFFGPVYKWSEGDRYYDLRMRVITGLKLGDSGSDVHVAVGGQIHMKIFSVDDNMIRAGFVLNNAAVSTSGMRDRMMESAVSLPVMVEMDKYGEFKSITLPAGADEQTSQILKGLYMPMEMVLKQKRSYSVVETDVIGRYNAEYRVKSGIVRKERTGYQRDSMTGSYAEYKPVFKRSEYIFKPDRDGVWVKSIVSDEIMGFVNSSGSEVISSAVNIEMNTADVPVTDKDAFTGLAYDDALKYLRSVDVVIAQNTLEDVGVKKVYSDTGMCENPVEPLKKYMEGLGVRGDRRSSLLMRDFLAGNRELINVIPGMLTDGSMTDEQQREIINILGLLSIPEAQTALLQIASSHGQTDQNRFRAVMAFSSISQPLIPELKEFMLSQADNISSADQAGMGEATSSVLAMGAVSRNLRENYPDAAEELANDLLRKAATADTLGKKYILLSLGNTADSRYSDDIGAYLKDSDPAIRGAAADSLKHMPDAEAEKMIAGQLAVENVEKVKTSLLHSLGKRDISSDTLSVVQNVAVNEKDEMARKEIIGILDRNAKGNQAVVNTLTEMLANEKSRENMKNILKAIGNAK